MFSIIKTSKIFNLFKALHSFTMFYNTLQLNPSAYKIGDKYFAFSPFPFHLFPLTFILFPQFILALSPSPLTRKRVLHSQSNNHAANGEAGDRWIFLIEIRGLWYLRPPVHLFPLNNWVTGSTKTRQGVSYFYNRRYAI